MKDHSQIALKLFKAGPASLTVSECVALIGDLLVAMAHQGQQIRDYDCKDRTLYGIKKVRGRYFFLAADDGRREGARR